MLNTEGWMTTTSDFHYELPAEAIAQEAIEPRHASRLLDTRTMNDHRFMDLPELLQPGDLVVVNRTRVRRARLVGRRPSGGRIEILLLRALDGGRWEGLARPSKRLKAGSTVLFGSTTVTLAADPDAGRVVLETTADLEALAASEGAMPLPPYFEGELDDPERYQTVFADRIGSAAAPTAGLHFTSQVVAELANRGIEIGRIDLEVGLDTFRPIVTDDLSSHVMHSERVVVGEELVAQVASTRDRGGRVVAVGTTVVRALESAARGGTLTSMDAPTELFITPGFEFRVVDLVVTNFHVPGSTLVVMIAAMLGDRWREVYRVALERGYRFLSFGDAMLLEARP
jgi:S-adenosylmethionine:tRNA ribosyltransferase-isomerase